MKIGIIDAEIMGKSKHRFPNLVCMKISYWHKQLGDIVELCLDYNDINQYDKVYLSKVFVKTVIPNEDETIEKTEQNVAEFYAHNTFLQNPKIVYGGTGFFYDKAPALPNEIEHCMPDYHLYDKWVAQCISNGANPKEFRYYTDFSIGFLTRGCFRQCQFCVNRNYRKCELHSNLTEFYDSSRKYLCFLDDNFLSCAGWQNIISEVQATGKRFQFKQGLDERLLMPKTIRLMSKWKYLDDMIFAFDNIDDKELIISKLEMLYKEVPTWKKPMRFYVFCGYDRANKYDQEFWVQDIKNTFERIYILSKYSCLPYIMRHENYKNSPYAAIYISLAQWCNMCSPLKCVTFEESCKYHGMKVGMFSQYKNRINDYEVEFGEQGKGSSWRGYDKFVQENPECKPLTQIHAIELVEHGAWLNSKNKFLQQ